MAGEFENLIMRDTRTNQPAAGIAGRLYYVTDENTLERDSGATWETVEGVGGTAIANSNISPTTSNVSAAVNTRYFADVSGLTANRNFVLPAGAVGDEIELNITVGDDTYFLVPIGDTSITINGGSAATAWGYVRETGMTLKFIATSTTNWQLVKFERRSELDYVEFTSNATPTATTEATADTVVTGSAIMYDGVTPIVIEFFSDSVRPRSDASGNLTLWLYDGSSSIGRIGLLNAYEAGAVTQPVLVRRRLTPSAASHTYSIRASVNGGTGLVVGGAGGAGADVPGYIRITKANP